MRTETRSPDSETLYTFAKNSVEEVRASFTRYRGHDLADVRVYYRDDDGQLQPSRKGVCISVDLLPELRSAVGCLGEEALTRGLVDKE